MVSFIPRPGFLKRAFKRDVVAEGDDARIRVRCVESPKRLLADARGSVDCARYKAATVKAAGFGTAC
jgi:hypothetical protein